jgi:thiol-disulfide isomerase/thioredoxin
MPNARSRRNAIPPPKSGARRPVIWLAGAAAGLVTLAIVGWAVLNQGGQPGGSTAGGGHSGVTLVAYQGAETLGGKRVDLGAVLGKGKPVVLNFFAGLCPPCRAEMPGFEQVWQRYKDQFVLLGADIGPFLDLGSHDDAKRLLADLGITYPAAYVEENVVSRFRIAGMPTTILYDAQGDEVGRHTGLMTEDQLEAAVQALIADTP